MMTKKMITDVENYIEGQLGARKYRVDGRYGYQAIDVYGKRGNRLRNYAAGLTKREAHRLLSAIKDGIDDAMKVVRAIKKEGKA